MRVAGRSGGYGGPARSFWVFLLTGGVLGGFVLGVGAQAVAEVAAFYRERTGGQVAVVDLLLLPAQLGERSWCR